MTEKWGGVKPAQVWRRTASGSLGTPRGGLLGEECNSCGEIIFPLRDICPDLDCRADLGSDERASLRPEKTIVFDASQSSEKNNDRT